SPETWTASPTPSRPTSGTSENLDVVGLAGALPRGQVEPGVAQGHAGQGVGGPVRMAGRGEAEEAELAGGGAVDEGVPGGQVALRGPALLEGPVVGGAAEVEVHGVAG